MLRSFLVSLLLFPYPPPSLLFHVKTRFLPQRVFFSSSHFPSICCFLVVLTSFLWSRNFCKVDVKSKDSGEFEISSQERSPLRVLVCGFFFPVQLEGQWLRARLSFSYIWNFIPKSWMTEGLTHPRCAPNILAMTFQVALESLILSRPGGWVPPPPFISM